MATTYLQSLLHHHLSSSDTIPSSTTTNNNNNTTLFLKPSSTFQKLSTTHSTHFAIHSTNAANATNATNATTPLDATTPSPPATPFDLLQQHLSSQDFRQADEETRRLIIFLAGEPAQKRGYVFFSEVQFISESDLKTIDNLWRKYSENRFGYSVQKKIYEKEREDFSLFFRKVGWMKKLDTEIEQYNYRAFPNEFTWELNDGTPEGHLPLTNALRGTQLLKSILYHPAFQSVEEVGGEEQGSEMEQQSKSSKSLNKGLFKTDYSF